MSTITLYKDKVNGVGSLLDDIIKSSNNLNVQLGTLKNTIQGVNSSTCDLQSTVDSISSSSKSEDEKVEDLKKLNSKLTEFIELTDKRDEAARDTINQVKEDFYSKYSYLKPECEKSVLEHIADGVKKAVEWCKEHWKEILLVLEVIAAVICLLIPGLEGIGIAILEHMLKGMLIGLVSGLVIGGVAGYAQNGVDGILPGMLNGAVDGALMGGIFGGLSGLGSGLGVLKGCSDVMKGISTVSKTLSLGMAGFDLTALANNFQNRLYQDTGIFLGLVNPAIGNKISEWNAKAHSSNVYNFIQLGVSATAVFSSSYVKSAACFVAGTLVATVNGLVAIETIKAGDYVLSTEPNTMQTGYKPVLETYIRKVESLVHLTINREKIITTFDHPFYVREKGFVIASELWIGAKLVNNNDDIFLVEEIYREILKNETRNVYNFQVEELHTYHVGNNMILVHNADYKDANIKDFEIKDKHLSESTGKRWRKFNVSTPEEANKIVQDAINNGKMYSISDNGIGAEGQNSYSVLLDAGKVIGTKGETFIKLVYDDLNNVWTTYPVPKP